MSGEGDCGAVYIHTVFKGIVHMCNKLVLFPCRSNEIFKRHYDGAVGSKDIAVPMALYAEEGESNLLVCLCDFYLAN